MHRSGNVGRTFLSGQGEPDRIVRPTFPDTNASRSQPMNSTTTRRPILGAALRSRHCIRTLILLVIGLSGLEISARGQEATWKAGNAKALITPEKAVWLAGYGSKRVPDGKLHDLWMKALAL